MRTVDLSDNARQAISMATRERRLLETQVEAVRFDSSKFFCLKKSFTNNFFLKKLQLSGRLAEEFVARQQLELQFEANATAHFRHLSDAQRQARDAQRRALMRSVSNI